MSPSSKRFRFAALVLAVACHPSAASASTGSRALRAIRAMAASLGARRTVSRSQLRAPARAIAVRWAKIEPAYASNGDVIVETMMLNRAIASLENDWARDIGHARVDARHVANAAQTLLDATE